MRVIAWIDALTAPTSDIGQRCFQSISGGLIAHAASPTWSATLLGIISAPIISSERSPRTRLINAITFTLVVAVVDYYIPYHRLLSCFIAYMATHAIGQQVSDEIPFRAAVSFGITYIPSLIGKLFRYSLGQVDGSSVSNWTNLALITSMTGEVIGIAGLGGFIGMLMLGPNDIGECFRVWRNELAGFSLLASGSFVATNHLAGSPDLYAHYKLLDKIAAVGAIIGQALIISALYAREQRQRE